jgi:hypothetical protein
MIAEIKVKTQKPKHRPGLVFSYNLVHLLERNANENRVLGKKGHMCGILYLLINPGQTIVSERGTLAKFPRAMVLVVLTFTI